MKLYNTLTREIEEFKPISGKTVTIYSCGPTLYDHIHIGNLSSFIYADTLKRALKANGYKVKHVMNFTDVDDKTIARSRERYPDDDPNTALKKLTQEYGQLFLDDMKAIGNDIDDIEFLPATEHIPEMRELTARLHKDGFAYIAGDGVYFSIEAYEKSGKTYGQLTNITASNTSSARISNDEYDKENIHDFALWKTQKNGEPAWEFELAGHKLLGRPGWHIECSAMSTTALGQPFDIHTGGVDLIFPHHENEIAQSTAGKDSPTMANFFFHNEHLLVDGKKMSKSLNNFYTLDDLKERGFDPLAFRLMVLQSHYRKQSNFTWDNLEAAQNRLKDLRTMADLRWQLHKTTGKRDLLKYQRVIMESVSDSMNIPQALSDISGTAQFINDTPEVLPAEENFKSYLLFLDELLGLGLLDSKDINNEHKTLLKERNEARADKDWNKSDELRQKLKEQGIEVRDTPHGQIWSRI